MDFGERGGRTRGSWTRVGADGFERTHRVPQQLDDLVLVHHARVGLGRQLGLDALAPTLRAESSESVAAVLAHAKRTRESGRRTFHSSARTRSSSSPHVSVPLPRRRSMKPHANARSMTTSTSGTRPPPGERLLRPATNGSRRKPSGACQGASDVELPEMTSCRREMRQGFQPRKGEREEGERCSRSTSGALEEPRRRRSSRCQAAGAPHQDVCKMGERGARQGGDAPLRPRPRSCSRRRACPSRTRAGASRRRWSGCGTTRR